GRPRGSRGAGLGEAAAAGYERGILEQHGDSRSVGETEIRRLVEVGEVGEVRGGCPVPDQPPLNLPNLPQPPQPIFPASPIFSPPARRWASRSPFPSCSRSSASPCWS